MFIMAPCERSPRVPSVMNFAAWTFSAAERETFRPRGSCNRSRRAVLRREDAPRVLRRVVSTGRSERDIPRLDIMNWWEIGFFRDGETVW